MPGYYKTFSRFEGFTFRSVCKFHYTRMQGLIATGIYQLFDELIKNEYSNEFWIKNAIKAAHFKNGPTALNMTGKIIFMTLGR